MDLLVCICGHGMGRSKTNRAMSGEQVVGYDLKLSGGDEGEVLVRNAVRMNAFLSKLRPNDQPYSTCSPSICEIQKQPRTLMTLKGISKRETVSYTSDGRSLQY
jgi:hypothetical protein